MLNRTAVFGLAIGGALSWLPRPEDQPTLDLSPLKGDIARHVH